LDRGFRNAERLGKKRDQRLVGFSLLRNRCDTDLNVAFAFGIGLDAIDRVAPAIRVNRTARRI
jgi:hypothetical protein